MGIWFDGLYLTVFFYISDDPETDVILHERVLFDGVEEIFTLRGYWIHIWLTDLRFFVLSLSGYAFRLVAIVTPT